MPYMTAQTHICHDHEVDSFPAGQVSRHTLNLVDIWQGVTKPIQGDECWSATFL